MKTRRRIWLVSLVSLTLACSGEDSRSADTSDAAQDDSQSQATPQPIQVFLMAGQSNMVGYGPLTDADTGDWPESMSLGAMIESGTASAALLQTRDDVWVHFQSDDNVQTPGLLEPGFGADTSFFGPELGFGEVLGEALDTPLVLFKSATGGTTLGSDWRPPAAVQRAGGVVGPLYTNMFSGFSSFLETNLSETFPADYADRGFEIAGFIWLQGWNDQFEDGFVAAYEENLVDLVEDVRRQLALPRLPVLIVEGPTLDQALRDARIAALSRLEEETPGCQALVETNDLVNIEVEGNFHFNFNAGNYLEVGRRMARALLEEAP